MEQILLRQSFRLHPFGVYLLCNYYMPGNTGTVLRVKQSCPCLPGSYSLEQGPANYSF